MINLLVRIKNKAFWLALIPAVLLLVQVVAAPFGYQWDFAVLNQQLAAIINAAFTVLAILGVVVDPTTRGVTDSVRALDRKEPAPNAWDDAVDFFEKLDGGYYAE